MHGGKAHAKGTLDGNGQAQLRLGDLEQGRYVLRVQGQSKPTTIVVG